MIFKEKKISEWVIFLFVIVVMVGSILTYILTDVYGYVYDIIISCIFIVLLGLVFYSYFIKVIINDKDIIFSKNFKTIKINYDNVRHIVVEEDKIRLKTYNCEYEVSIRSLKNKDLLIEKLQEIKSKYSI